MTGLLYGPVMTSLSRQLCGDRQAGEGDAVIRGEILALAPWGNHA